MADIQLVSAGIDAAGNLDVAVETDLNIITNIQVDYDLNTVNPKTFQGAITGAGPTLGFQLCETQCPSPNATTEFIAKVDGLDSAGVFHSLALPQQGLTPPAGTVNGGDTLDLTLNPTQVRVGDVITLSVEYKDVSGQPDPGITIFFSKIFGVVVGSFSSQTAVTDAQGKCSVEFTVRRTIAPWIRRGPILFMASAAAGAGHNFAPKDFEIVRLVP